MKKLILFTLLSVLTFVGFGQTFGRITALSGLYDNKIVNGPDTFKLGWRTDRFSLGTDNAKSFELLVNGIHSGYIDTVHVNLFYAGITHFGYRAGQKDTMHSNTFIGYYAGMSNTSGFANVAVGSKALMNNTTALYNTAVGDLALQSASTNGYNTAVGQAAMMLNTGGQMNTAVGEDAMQLGTTGSFNTAIGAAVLLHNNGSSNTAIGQWAGWTNTTGSYNLFIGNEAGYWGTWSHKGFIDNQRRTDSATQLISSPIIIDFNAAPSLQNVTFNADIIINSLVNQADSILVTDESSIILDNGISGWGEVYAFNAGVIAEWAEFIFNSDGTVYLKENSTNVVTTDTDTKFCIFDNGSGVTIRNRLGGSRTVKYIIHH